MIVYKYEANLPGFEEHYSTAELDTEELGLLESAGAERVWYWYGTGGYEGGGYAIINKGNEYDMLSLSHCSCNGPVDSQPNWRGAKDGIDRLYDSCSGELKKETGPLFLMAGYKVKVTK